MQQERLFELITLGPFTLLYKTGSLQTEFYTENNEVSHLYCFLLLFKGLIDCLNLLQQNRGQVVTWRSKSNEWAKSFISWLPRRDAGDEELEYVCVWSLLWGVSWDIGTAVTVFWAEAECCWGQYKGLTVGTVGKGYLK